MINEELLEYGIVKSSEGGIAVVALQENEKCTECSAKIFCKADNSMERELIVKDSGRAAPGSKVLISVSGKEILTASIMLYGMPLVLILTGIIIGGYIFTYNKELYSALAGLALAAMYYLIFGKLEKNKERVISKIIYTEQSGNY